MGWGLGGLAQAPVKAMLKKAWSHKGCAVAEVCIYLMRAEVNTKAFLE